ncbi:hypothetical protein SAICODRAFT_106826 [Saitoella complicata NRRL Y-17804]|uniref:uncharacterized protein n=1 Tax=Saitoella complicata (strain BCRC 22490 / CBS 7301 / JCM 7358 / NBRC 10748 / NRRL Y-17804) TaxID=698492 RepID=UPI000866F550|nr:uncharacterized protein SAICODRAFT_106826 [Saitoella complicata NRRL Y-17804]ODQ56329.1 hypothetical protein SAICODRAFT_106826 [Saitoella complicata NRRL Y-17804]
MGYQSVTSASATPVTPFDFDAARRLSDELSIASANSFMNAAAVATVANSPAVNMSANPYMPTISSASSPMTAQFSQAGASMAAASPYADMLPYSPITILPGSLTPIPGSLSSMLPSIGTPLPRQMPLMSPMPPIMPQSAGPGPSAMQQMTPSSSGTGSRRTSSIPSSHRPSSTFGPTYQSAYSASGFDMINILARVASRPNPHIDLGPVDFNCAFNVVDARTHDFPVVYASPSFETLTGYSLREIIGRNCRFLQSPTGRVKSGTRREYTDNEAIRYMKENMLAGKECQVTLVNYRKGGQPFLNMVTIIPITWDSDAVAYFVGFQTSLEEISSSGSRSGGMQMQQQRLGMGSGVSSNMTPAQSQQIVPVPIPVPQPVVASPMGYFGSGTPLVENMNDGEDPEDVRRFWDKLLLENSDDVVHVLSPKGVFLYASPSCRSVLKYEPEDMVGKSMSDFVHPSDLAPVMRELRESAANAIDVIYRVRQGDGNYIWFECHGKVLIEREKGRKYLVMAGRERRVYQVSWRYAGHADGFWSKLSFAGLYLFVTKTVVETLDLKGEEMVGTTFYRHVPESSAPAIRRALEEVRDRKSATIQHTMQHRKGHYVDVRTTFLPGNDSVSEGDGNGTPEYVIAQTRKFDNKSPAHSEDKTSPLGMTPSPLGVGGGGIVGVINPVSSPLHTPMAETPMTIGSTPMRPPSYFGLHRPGGDENVFAELATTRTSNWQYELHQLRVTNRRLKEELEETLKARKRKRRKNKAWDVNKVCANCQRRDTPEWRRGPDGKRSLCNRCGLKYAKLVGKTGSKVSNKDDGQRSATPMSVVMGAGAMNPPPVPSLSGPAVSPPAGAAVSTPHEEVDTPMTMMLFKAETAQ